MINSDSLKRLFIPFKLDFMDINHLMDTIGISDDEFLLDTQMYMECSKSKNGNCINSECQYNLVNLHDDELYIKLKNNGGIDLKSGSLFGGDAL